ncbi:FABR245Cp [Eremothecium gossypii FDAG1]|nr:FABR245Cp [Eremothecium gossypii FDAG1]
MCKWCGRWIVLAWEHQMSYRRSLSIWRLRTIRVPLLLALLGSVSVLLLLSLTPHMWPGWPSPAAREVPASPESQAPASPELQAPASTQPQSPAGSKTLLQDLLLDSKKPEGASTPQMQCKRYFEGTYLREPSWANSVLRMADDFLTATQYTARLLERWRIFADCFVIQDFQISDTLSNKIDMHDFHQRMFPFLAKKREWRDMWPVITDINTGMTFEGGAVWEGRQSEIDDGASFWKNWRSFSHGKGITMSVGDGHLEMLLRMLTVLDYLGNELPIEIVEKGGELSQQFRDKLTEFVRNKSKQKVRIISCARTLDETHARLIFGFSCKWVALMFNTFEEAIFLDVDAVPYILPEQFFDMEGYKSTGIMLFRDRLIDQHVSKECPDAVRQMIPTQEETSIWNHKAKFSGPAANKEAYDNTKDEGAAAVYDRFFRDHYYHVVESGVVVFNKKNKLQSIVNSFMLNLNFYYVGCFYGDKELMWVGQLLSAEDYYIHPAPPAILGSAEEFEREGNTVSYRVCGAQIGHMELDGSLLWTNGGLRTCKFTDTAEQDFSKSPEYFNPKYSSPQQLQEHYSKPLEIQLIFIPELTYSVWEKSVECQGYTWCSTVTLNPENPSEFKSIVMKGDTRLEHYNNISQRWNSASF